MKSTTNSIEFDDATDLLTSGARACIGFVADGKPRVEPVDVRYEGERFVVSMHPDAALPPETDEVVLVVDEGVLFFDLRAMYVRGRPARVSKGSPNDRASFELEPIKTTCWDYGRLRLTDAAA